MSSVGYLVARFFKSLASGWYAATDAIDDVLSHARHLLPEGDVQCMQDIIVPVCAAAKLSKPEVHGARPSGKLPGHGIVIELCTSPDSNMQKACCEFSGLTIIPVTKTENFCTVECERRILKQLEDYPGTAIHASLPFTVWSTWQYVNVSRLDESFAADLKRRRKHSRKLLKSFIRVAERALALGGEVSFEWPRNCSGWLLPELVQFISKHGLFTALVDGCAAGLRDKKGRALLKKLRFVTSLRADSHCFVWSPLRS